MDRAVKQLTQLHLVVELASLVQTYLCLPPDALRNLVQTALVELRDAEDDRTDFRFPIKTCHLKEQLEKVGPNNWQVHLHACCILQLLNIDTSCGRIYYSSILPT